MTAATVEATDATERARREYTTAKQAWLDAWITGDPASDELWDRCRTLWREYVALGGEREGATA